MENQPLPFVVPELRPEGVGGQRAGVYQITAASAHPVRIIGRDEVGMPIEDTVPTVYYREFIMPDGGVNKVPLRTASVFSTEPEAVRYEHLTMMDLLRSGALPLWKCPFTREFAHITGGDQPLVVIRKEQDELFGVTDCGGSPHGCDHTKEIIKRRQARALERHKKEIARIEAMKFDEIEKFKEGLVEGIGAAIAKHARPDAVSRLRDNKADKDK